MTDTRTLNLPPLRYGYALRLFYFLLITFVGLMVALVAMTMILRGGNTTPALRIATVMQDLLLFIVPAVVTAVIVSGDGGRLLCVDRLPSGVMALWALIIYICAIPAMNALVAWNESLSLPASLAPLEEWMRMSEEAAQAQVKILLGGTSWGDLIVSVLIVGVLAGVSEELFFRGAMQRLISSGRVGSHTAIWITAVLFSVFHMQFYGFFPRVVLGAFFGYLLWWSGSVWLSSGIHALNNTLVVITSWQMRRDPASEVTDIDKIGADSVLMIVISVILAGCAFAVLNYITKKQNSVTREG